MQTHEGLVVIWLKIFWLIFPYRTTWWMVWKCWQHHYTLKSLRWQSSCQTSTSNWRRGLSRRVKIVQHTPLLSVGDPIRTGYSPSCRDWSSYSASGVVWMKSTFKCSAMVSYHIIVCLYVVIERGLYFMNILKAFPPLSLIVVHPFHIVSSWYIISEVTHAVMKTYH